MEMRSHQKTVKSMTEYPWWYEDLLDKYTVVQYDINQLRSQLKTHKRDDYSELNRQ